MYPTGFPRDTGARALLPESGFSAGCVTSGSPDIA